MLLGVRASARRRGKAGSLRYLLANGVGAVLPAHDPLAASEWIGRGDNDSADAAAVEAMRAALNELPIDGTVVIGEGERDEAPMLFIGEKVGTGEGQTIDIALDPLEGTTLTAKEMPDALSVIAMAEGGSLLHAPDCYMDKIAIGGGFPEGLVDLDLPPGENVRRLAEAKGVAASAVTASASSPGRLGA